MSQSRIHATIKFQTGLGGVRHVTKLWNGQSHIDNYVTFMKRNQGWTFDEIFVTPK
ncbi:MAG: hypothetical protein GY794_17540 [bacterium]|jgi:hypothetical protein|nr:hypothetical protein [bacterium]